jgi:hypothetical protein
MLQAMMPPLRQLSILACTFLAITPSAFAFDGSAPSSSAAVSDIVGPSAYAELKSAGKLVRTNSDAKLGLLPASAAAGSIAQAVAAQKPGIVVEALFILPRKRPADEAGRKAELASVYGLMRSFSTLKGIEYYSASRGKMRTLYAESYRIDDPVKRHPLPDQPPLAADAVPASETMLAFQEDLSFGANVYRYAFSSYPDAILVESLNLTRMSYGIVPAVAAEKLATRVLVICAEDAIVFYSESGADAPGLLKSKIGESFANRAEVLFRWFSAKYAALAR